MSAIIESAPLRLSEYNDRTRHIVARKHQQFLRQSLGSIERAQRVVVAEIVASQRLAYRRLTVHQPTDGTTTGGYRLTGRVGGGVVGAAEEQMEIRRLVMTDRRLSLSAGDVGRAAAAARRGDGRRSWRPVDDGSHSVDADSRPVNSSSRSVESDSRPMDRGQTEKGDGLSGDGFMYADERGQPGR